MHTLFSPLSQKILLILSELFFIRQQVMISLTQHDTRKSVDVFDKADSALMQSFIHLFCGVGFPQTVEINDYKTFKNSYKMNKVDYVITFLYTFFSIIGE